MVKPAPTVQVGYVRPGVLEVTVTGAADDDRVDVEVDTRSRPRLRQSWLERLRAALFDN